jgi:3-methyl-2-oxobutanoate hydroxymethyltransferase
MENECKITAPKIKAMKGRGRKIVAVTAYDATFSRLVDRCGIDIVLVGDSLGMVIQGEASTIPVRIEHMIYHCRAVSKGLKKAHLVVDMPFLTFQISHEEALRNAGRLVQEGNAEAVKLEGGIRSARAVQGIVEAGIPVMGHVGLTPQSVNAFGGHRIQGKTEEAAQKVLEDALALEEAGCYSIVLEGIPKDLSMTITEKLSIPTIGISAGQHCDGQVLVLYDLLGLDPDFNPKFLKKYENLAEKVINAVKSYASEVREGNFPSDEHSF